jgi:Tfp pilus assembly protein PilO
MNSTAKLAYIILAIVIGYFFVYSPLGELTSLAGKKQEYETSLAMVKNIENVKNELSTKFNGISANDKKNIDIVLPNSLDFVRLISQIDAVAAGYGISIGGISSKGISSPVGASVGDAGVEKPYNSATINFTFTASYEKFNAFMDELGRSMRILDIRSMRLASGKDGIYSYSVEFETYWLK